MRMSLGVARSHRHQKSLKLLSPGERSAKILAVAAQKGGVGKTTTAVSIASAWARLHGLHVLIVDLDPQANVSISVRSQILALGGRHVGPRLSRLVRECGVSPSRFMQ